MGMYNPWCINPIKTGIYDNSIQFLFTGNKTCCDHGTHLFWGVNNLYLWPCASQAHFWPAQLPRSSLALEVVEVESPYSPVMRCSLLSKMAHL